MTILCSHALIYWNLIKEADYSLVSQNKGNLYYVNKINHLVSWWINTKKKMKIIYVYDCEEPLLALFVE